jgi:DNA-directed RNA polymerase subunit B
MTRLLFFFVGKGRQTKMVFGFHIEQPDDPMCSCENKTLPDQDDIWIEHLDLEEASVSCTYHEPKQIEEPMIPNISLTSDLPDLEGIVKFLTRDSHERSKIEDSEKKKFSDSVLPPEPPYLSICSSFFNQNLNQCHVRSYEMLLLEHIPSIIYTNGIWPTLFEDKSLPDDDINKKIRYTMRFENATVKPSDASPQFCHENGTHYTCDIFADAIIDSEYDNKLLRHPPLVLKRHPQHRKNMLVARIVLMTGVDPDSDYDLVGVIIVRGKVRTAPAIKGAIQDFGFIFRDKDSTMCQIRSTHHDKFFRSSSTLNIEIKSNVLQSKFFGFIGVWLPFAKKAIPIATIIKALGYTARAFNHLVKLCAKDKYIEHKFKSYEVSMIQREPKTQDDAFIDVAKLYKRKTIQTGQCQIQNEVLPHLKHKNKDIEVQQKIFFLALWTAKTILSHEGIIPIVSRDCWAMSQIVTCANHIGALFRTQFSANMKQAGKTLRRKLLENHSNVSPDLSMIDLEVVHCEKRISDRCASGAATGIWTTKRNGVTIALNTSNEDAMVLQIRQIYSPLKQTNGGHEEARGLTKDQYGFIDPVNTPDNTDTGLVYELAMMATISPPIPLEMTEVIIDLIIIFSGDNVEQISHFFAKPYPLKQNQRFLMDISGAYTHIIHNVDKFIHMFRMMRRNLVLDRFVFIADYDPQIVIMCREGLICRPLIIASRVKDITSEITFQECLSKGIIEYVSAQEQLTLTKIAMCEADITPNTTHVEIMQSAFLGLISSSVFFANCRQSGRLTLICTQFKQTIRAVMSKHRGQQSSAHLLYAFRNLVTTTAALLRPGSEVGRGTIAVVAILADREPQEDSNKIKKSFVERGGLLAATRLTYISEACTNLTSISEEFECPNYVLSKKTHSYKHLDPETGIVPKGTKVDDESILIGKTQTVDKSPYDGHKNAITGQSMGRKQSAQMQMKRCISTCVRRGHGGEVVRATLSNQPGGQRAEVTVETLRPFKLADKLDTDDAMKGVGACLTPDEDMPFSELTGMSPDLIFAPLGPLSRMTPSFMQAGITGKVVALYGEFGHGVDTQNFNETRDHHMKIMGDLLAKTGFERFGREMMRSGITGEQIGMTEMFLLNIERLNHLCECKVHFRETGSVDPKTRQPKDGRKNGSGARNSEMEHAVFHAYGVAEIAQQRFCDLSDKFPIYICKSCCLIIDDFGADIGFSWCRRCADHLTVRKVKVCFMLIVLLYHLNALGISSFLEVVDAEHMFIRPIE